MPNTFIGNNLQVIGGLNYKRIEKAGLDINTFRYDHVLICLFLSGTPSYSKYQHWRTVPDEVKRLMIKRVAELGIPDEPEFSHDPTSKAEMALWNSYRFEIEKGERYRFERSSDDFEEISLSLNEFRYLA